MSDPASTVEPLVPPLALAAYIACVAGAGALANCSVLATLFKTARNGIFCIIIQLAIADFTLIGTSLGPELWASNAKKWHFGRSGCAAYQGLSVFASTASAYLIATLALHTLATINLEEKAVARRSKRNHDDDDEEMQSSRHSLVANSDSSTPPRTMNVDYRLSNTMVSVTPPTTFVWVLATSLSLPVFVLATTVHVDRENVLCTCVDTNHRINMQAMLAVFDLFLPTLIMSVAGTLVIVKLKTMKRFLQVYSRESVAALRLSFWQIVVYGVLCIPRSITTVYHVYSTSGSVNEISAVDLTPKNYTTALIKLAFSGAYLAAALIRPLLCILLLPRLKKVFCAGSRDTATDDV